MQFISIVAIMSSTQERVLYMKPQMPKLGKWLQHENTAAFWRQTWRQKTMPDMASIVHWWDNPMPCLASFFDAMSGVKKMLHFNPVITYPTSAFPPSTLGWVYIYNTLTAFITGFLAGLRHPSPVGGLVAELQSLCPVGTVVWRRVDILKQILHCYR